MAGAVPPALLCYLCAGCSLKCSLFPSRPQCNDGRHIPSPCFFHTACTIDCPDQPLDLVIVIDASFSVEDERFTVLKNFAARLLENFTLGLGADVHISVISYAFEVSVKYHLDNILSGAVLQSRIRSIDRPRYFRATRTARAIQASTKEFAEYSRSASEVIHAMVLLTDGKTTDAPFLDAAIASADLSGYSRFAVGVPPLPDGGLNELNLIAGDPERVFMATDEALGRLSSALAQCRDFGYCP